MTYLLGKLRMAWRVTAFVVVTLATWLVFEANMLLRGKTPRIDVINRWVPRWSSALMWIFGVRIDARGPYVDQGRLYPGRGANGVGRIFIMNHRSGMDIPIVFTQVAAHVISRHDLAQWPLIGQGARRIGTLFVDRSSRRSGAEVLRTVHESLVAGEGIAMFPEGTAFSGDEVHEFRPGAFKAAVRAGAEIVPMGVAYEDPAASYRDESFMAHLSRGASFRCLRVAVEIGEPLSSEGVSAIELKEMAREQLVQLVEAARARVENRESPLLYPTLVGKTAS